MAEQTARKAAYQGIDSMKSLNVTRGMSEKKQAIKRHRISRRYGKKSSKNNRLYMA